MDNQVLQVFQEQKEVQEAMDFPVRMDAQEALDKRVLLVSLVSLAGLAFKAHRDSLEQ